MSDSNRVRVSLVKEASFLSGTPSTPAMLVMETTGQSMEDQIGYTQSQTIRNDANVKDLIRLTKSSGGGLPCELTYPTTNEALATQMIAVMRAAVGLADAEIATLGGVTSGQSTVARLTADGSWKIDGVQVGDIVKVVSLSNDAITRYAKVTGYAAGAGITVTATDASDVLNMTPPPPNGTPFRLTNSGGALPGGLAVLTTYYVVNRNAGANTFQAAATLGGSALPISTDGTGTHTYVSQESVLNLQHADGGTWPSSDSLVAVLRGHRLTNGTESTSFSVEVSRLDIGKHQTFSKQVADGMTLNVSDGQITTCNFTYQGRTIDRGDYAVGASYTNPTANPIMDCIGVPYFVLGGNSYAVKSFSLSVTNNVQARTQVGSLGATGVRYGAFTVTGRVQAYMSTFSEMDNFANNTPSDFWFVLRDANGQSVSVSLPQFKWSNVSAATRGLNQDDYMEASFQAYLDPSELCTMRVFLLAAG